MDNENVQTLLVLAIGFLVGMVPAMLLVGFFGGRQVEKQRKELKLQYDRQIVALRATIQRLMQRIDKLGGERAQLKKSNRDLRDALRDQQIVANDASAELIQSKDQLERLVAENLRHEGRLEESRKQQDRMEAQFTQTVSQFTDAERLRRHLIFAANQLRAQQASGQAIESAPDSQTSNRQYQELTDSSPADLDVAVIEGMEPVYVERLHDSGIYTIADLAGQTPARVAHFAGLSSWDMSTQWITEAKTLLAAPPHAGP